ncbi:hypothetical protein JCM10207_005811 [Rhodosporidiobolus poonsookiae]
MSPTFDPDALAAQLTLEEAVALTHGKDFWRLNGVERLGVPSGLKLSDGPNGARGEDFVGGTTSACFPAGVCLAASFDHATAVSVGKALAEECRTKSASAILGPTVNIHRSPLGGRNFESYSEDPVLSGYIASGYIKGVQNDGDVTAVIKHFLGNDSETDRRSVDVLMGEQALREIYARPFQIAFAQAQPGGLMTAYNKVNGSYVTDDKRLVISILREEWAVKDLFSVSDWGGAYSTEPAILAGLSLEMPNSFHRGNSKLLSAASANPELAAAVRYCARDVLTLIGRSGGYDLPPEGPERAEDLLATRAIIRQAGAEGMTLLKNNGVLPLPPSAFIAAVGTFALSAQAHGGGSASLDVHYKVSPAEGLASRFGTVKAVPGVPAHIYLPLPPPGVTCSPDGVSACVVHFYNKDGTLVETRPLGSTFLTALDRYPTALEPGWTAVMKFVLRPKTSGLHSLAVAAPSDAELFINGQRILQHSCSPPIDSFMHLAFHLSGSDTVYSFEVGKDYSVEIRYKSTQEVFFATAIALNGIRFGYLEAVDEDKLIRDAVDAAEKAGVAVVCVGHGSDYETEGFDRTSLSLLGRQDDLVSALAASSAKVVVVIFTGSPISMPWLDKVDAVVQAWFPGQEVGNALADILSGEVNPSGRLPVTFPLCIENTPCYGNFPGVNEVIKYEEGVFVGYRHYTSRNVPVLFPFGFGLSYTTFDVSSLTVSGTDTFASGTTLTVAVSVRNTGSRAGRHAALVFVAPPIEHTPARPALSLEGFAKSALLQPGEAQTLEVPLAGDAFSTWVGGEAGCWEVKPGVYRVQVRADAASAPLQEVIVEVKKGWEWKGLRA